MDGTAERIFTLLKEKGIEQKEFAALVGTTDKTVSAWKTGRSKSYTKYLSKIASLLDTTVEFLLNGNSTLVQLLDETPYQGSINKLFEIAEAKFPLSLEIMKDHVDSIPEDKTKGCVLYLDMKICNPDSPPNKKPVILKNDGQAEIKLAQALGALGIEVDKLSDADISRIARLAKAALEE